jgi:hypothetical protein
MIRSVLFLFRFCIAGRHALLGWFINGKWANIMHFLGCVLCLAFSVAWDQVRAVVCFCATRCAVQSIAFIIPVATQ